MNKILLAVLFIIVTVMPVTAEWSKNVSVSEGWAVFYEKDGEDKPVKFDFQNISGYTAFNILWVVNFYDSFDKYLGRKQGNLQGPIHKYFWPNLKAPKNCSRMTAEVYCSWQ